MPESFTVLARFGHVLLIVALLAATGAHWTLLQSAAWAAMLADNLRSNSLGDAVQRTFDGKHPCPLCQQIAAGKKSEKKPEFPGQLKKLEFLAATPRFVFLQPARACEPARAEAALKSLLRAPPTPPPRAARS